MSKLLDGIKRAVQARERMDNGASAPANPDTVDQTLTAAQAEIAARRLSVMRER